MDLSRTGPGTAMVLSVIALVLLAVAPFGWRLGWWPYSFGLYWLMPASGFVGVVAVSLCVLSQAAPSGHGDNEELLPRPPG